MLLLETLSYLFWILLLYEQVTMRSLKSTGNPRTKTTSYTFAAHDRKTKSVIEFFLRAFLICSDEFLADELDFVKKRFL